MNQDKKPSRAYLLAKLREARSEFVALFGWPIAAERLVEAVDAVLALESPSVVSGEGPPWRGYDRGDLLHAPSESAVTDE